MKPKLPSVVAAFSLVLLTAGCATRNTSGGGRETNVLGGAVTVTKDSFQPTNPATLDVDTSKIAGKNGPSGNKVTLFWGLLTFRDY